MEKIKANLTNLDKIFWPKLGYTKGDLVEYYQNVSKYILPYLANRPHSLLRQPNGISDKGFFQKDIDELPPKWVKTAQIYSQSNQKNIKYLVCDSLDSLLYMVQLGCIEINPWNSTISHLDKPDWIVIDLDPEGVSFGKVVSTALAVKEVCEELDIKSYPKTSGKTGIHIYLPVAAEYSYQECRQFAEILVNLVHEKLPDITSLERHPQKRRHKVYLDYLQNSQGQTLSSAYSVRPTPEASVSTPLDWREVNSRLDPKKFTIKTIPARLKKAGDLWKPVLGKGIDLPKTLAKIKT